MGVVIGIVLVAAAIWLWTSFREKAVQVHQETEHTRQVAYVATMTLARQHMEKVLENALKVQALSRDVLMAGAAQIAQSLPDETRDVLVSEAEAQVAAGSDVHEFHLMMAEAETKVVHQNYVTCRGEIRAIVSLRRAMLRNIGEVQEAATAADDNRGTFEQVGRRLEVLENVTRELNEAAGKLLHRLDRSGAQTS